MIARDVTPVLNMVRVLPWQTGERVKRILR
jgi:hypothetical protein